MVNAIIFSKNLYTIKYIIDNISDNINYKIVTSKKEFLEIASNNDFDIDIIFIDYDCDFDFKKKVKRNNYDIINIKKDENILCDVTLHKINNIIKSKKDNDTKSKIKDQLDYLGYNCKHQGTYYLIDAIYIIYSEKEEISNNLEKDIYPIIAEKYGKSIHNIKVSISRATEAMYCECDVDKLKRYFYFDYDTKPTTKQIIFDIINKIEK